MSPIAEQIAVLFGGPSPEHEISCRSAAYAVAELRRAGRQVTAIGIDRAGTWFYQRDPRPTDGEPLTVDGEVRDPSGLLAELALAGVVAFPVVHGEFGEDGTLAAVLAASGVRWAGAGVLASSVNYDKRVCRTLWEGAGLPLTPWECLDAASVDGTVESSVELPAFVKPSRSGSSYGVSRVDESARVSAAVAVAAEFDRHVLVERAVPNVRELEVSVIVDPDGQVWASEGGEVVVMANVFYDFEAKYETGGSDLQIPAELPPEAAQRIAELTVEVCRTSYVDGYARVDFLMDGVTGEIVVNEVNTTPGMTATSMFPRLLVHGGRSLAEMVDALARVGR